MTVMINQTVHLYTPTSSESLAVGYRCLRRADIRVVSQLFLDTGMKIFLKIRGNIRGIFKEKRGNNIQFASNTGRKIKIENVYQLNFFGSVKNILILTENESKYGGTVIYNTIITHKTKLLWPDYSIF